MKAQAVAQFIEEIAPIARGVPGDEYGFVFGDPNTEVQGIATCWSPTLEVIKRAIENAINMIVAHEPLFIPHSASIWLTSLPVNCKLPNIKRMELLVKHKICVHRSHSNWDAAPKHGTVDGFGAFLGFEKEIARGKYTRVYELEPVRLENLALNIKTKLGLPGLRVIGDRSRIITKAGTAIGGLGGIFDIPDELASLGAQVGIFGEMLDYTIRAAIEYDLCVIETAHGASENPGIRNFAQILQAEFPQVKVMFIDSGTPWTYI